ncbi:hypothetical protein SEVIR_5G287333v4 [Setaria viridis]
MVGEDGRARLTGFDRVRESSHRRRVLSAGSGASWHRGQCARGLARSTCGRWPAPSSRCLPAGAAPRSNVGQVVWVRPHLASLVASLVQEKRTLPAQASYFGSLTRAKQILDAQLQNNLTRYPDAQLLAPVFLLGEAIR